MNKNVAVTIIIFFAVIVGLIWIARPGGKQDKNLANSGSVLSGAFFAEESIFNFGAISMAAGKVSHSFKFKNTGDSPFSVSKIYTSCMCTTAKLSVGGKKFGPFGMPGHGFVPKINASVPAGEEGVVEAVFDPNAHGPAGVGKVERVITLENSAGAPLEFYFSATVTP